MDASNVSLRDEIKKLTAKGYVVLFLHSTLNIVVIIHYNSVLNCCVNVM